MEPELISRLEITEFKNDDAIYDRRVQVYLACGYWYDLGVPLSKPVPDLGGTTSQFPHAHGFKPPEVKRQGEKKPHKSYRKKKA